MWLLVGEETSHPHAVVGSRINLESCGAFSDGESALLFAIGNVQGIDRSKNGRFLERLNPGDVWTFKGFLCLSGFCRHGLLVARDFVDRG